MLQSIQNPEKEKMWNLWMYNYLMKTRLYQKDIYIACKTY